ncbi:MAG: phosphotransferase [Bacteroidales bacterium]|jgi:aminoglycoside/choline kinase family phosphotransferase|nr:phosphotransferase [Bacteroidales bacterium]
MDEINIISAGYKELFGGNNFQITPLPGSGSDRKYFRITTAERSLIGAFNPVDEENEAFVGFTDHFLSKGLNVPEVFGYLPDKHIYFLRDLGDINLYTWIRDVADGSSFSNIIKDFYRKVLDNLILFQTRGIIGLNLDLCYPHRSFDRQSMMWDMNYFKYMLLKLLAVPFNEQRLEHDFNALADFLLETDQEYFLYRDFQTANIMIVEGEPWYIDFQGGRKGAAQYDVASLLFDAKIPMVQTDREELLDYYIDRFCLVSNENKEKFCRYYTGFSMIRLMQALGAFGFRGLYEQKPTFTESLIPGVNLLLQVISSAEEHVQLPELYGSVRSIHNSGIFHTLASGKH